MFIDRKKVEAFFKGKRVCLVGSGPGVLDNDGAFIDGHDIVVRVNNYDTDTYPDRTGRRTDVFYSYFGKAIKKRPYQLQSEGVKLCMSKIPNDKILHSKWHEDNAQDAGVDFRIHYQNRRGFWFCPTYIPTTEEFMEKFHMLGKPADKFGGRVPTTGFAAFLDLQSTKVESLYVTGFDFFGSKIHNVKEKWRPSHKNDPIGHKPERERQIIADIVKRDSRITVDRVLEEIFK